MLILEKEDEKTSVVSNNTKRANDDVVKARTKAKVKHEFYLISTVCKK